MWGWRKLRRMLDMMWEGDAMAGAHNTGRGPASETTGGENRYAWQLDVSDFGAAGQARLRDATVLVSRVGGVGGTVALYLAAAGVGRLVLAHAGELRLNDLNRQILMNTPGVGSSRVEVAEATLTSFNPEVVVEAIPANIDAEHAAAIVGRCDLVVSAAPLFSERLAMNQAAVASGTPLIDAAMYDMEARLFVRETSRDPCLACLYPADTPQWKRRFPVLGAVSGTIGSLAAVAAIQVLTGMPRPATGCLTHLDFTTLALRRIAIARRDNCPVCGAIGKNG